MTALYQPSLGKGPYWIRSKENAKVLGVDSNRNAPLVCQDKYPDAKGFIDHSQMWFVEMLSDRNDKCFLIRNVKSPGLALDVQGSSCKDGAPVLAYQITGNDNQHWRVEWLNDDDDHVICCRVINVCTNTALTQMTGINPSVVSSSWNDGQQQRWSFEPVSLPTVYSITHCRTGWCLQYDSTLGATAGNMLDSITPKSSQFWYLEAHRNGDSYVIRNFEDETKVLDLSDSDTTEDAPIIANTYHGGPSQQWWITKIDPNASDNPRVLVVSALAHTVAQVIKGSESGTLRAQIRRDDASQSWRIIQQAGNISSDNRKDSVSLSQSHASHKEVSTNVSMDTNEVTLNAVKIDCKSASHTERKSILRRVFEKCFLPANNASTNSIKSQHLTITLKNTGTEYVSIKIYDSSEKTLVETAIRGSFIMELPVKLCLNKSYRFELQCGKASKTFSRKLTENDVEFDVETLFSLS